MPNKTLDGQFLVVVAATRALPRRLGALLLALACCIGPVVASVPPAYAAPPPEPQPSPGAAPAGGRPTPVAAVSSTHKGGVATTDGLVRVVTPAPDSLAGPRGTRVVLRIARGASRPTVTLGAKDVSRVFVRRGRDWVGLVSDVPAGQVYLKVRVRSGAKEGRAVVRLIGRGAVADLIQPDVAGAPRLGAASDPGVAPVTFRTARGSTLTLRLNDTAVDLGRSADGDVTSLVLSRRDGLRHGNNRLVVQAVQPDGTYEIYRRTIVVAPATPLAEADAARRVQTGKPVLLDGSTSSGGRGGPLTYSWKVLESPAGAPVGASPARATNARTAFVPTAPGRWVLSLTVTERSKAGRTSSSTDIAVVDAAPLVLPVGQRMETLVPDPATGSGVGTLLDNTWTSWEDDFADAPAGLYVIDHETLQLKTEPTKLTGSGAVIDQQLALRLGQVTPKDIVVLVGRSGVAGSTVLPDDGAFTHVVASPSGGSDLKQFAARGVWNKNVQLGDGNGKVSPAGGLSGYLRSDVTGNYRFVADGDVPFATSTPTSATTAAADGATYRLRSTADDQVVTGPRPDADLTLQTRGNDPHQQWQLLRAYGSFFQLRNRSTGSCMDAGSGPGAVVRQSPCTPPTQAATAQLWELSPSGEGWILTTATADAGGRVLTRSGSQLTAAKSNSGASQLWSLDIPPGVYTITSSQTGRAMVEPDDARSLGAGLLTAPVTGELRQQWQVIDKPTVRSSQTTVVETSMALRNVGSGLCLDVPDGSQAAGTQLERWTCDPDRADQENQRWQPRPDAVNGMTLASLNSAKGTTLLLDDVDGKVVQTASAPNRAVTGWSFNRLPDPVPGGGYAVVAADSSGRALDAGDGTPAARASAASRPAQAWTLSEADGGHMNLRSRSTGQCLQLALLSSGVKEDDCSSSGTWDLVAQDDGTYSLATTKSPRRLLSTDPEGELTADDEGDARLVQRWILTGRGVTFRIGPQRVVTSLPPGAQGFAVMAVDQAYRPLPGQLRWYATNGPGSSVVEQEALNQQLQDLAARRGPTAATVLLQSVGRPQPNSDRWNTLADNIGILGGDRISVLQLDGSGDFAFVGCSGCSQGQPVFNEVVRHQVDKDVFGARLEGTLQRGQDSLATAESGTSSRIDDTIAALAVRPATAWPFESGAELEVLGAISRLGGPLTFPPTCDAEPDPIRGSYCLQTGGAGPWADRKAALANVNFADFERPMFDEPTFDRVRAGLLEEWGDLIAVDTMMQGAGKVLGNVGSASAYSDDIAHTIEAAFPEKTEDRHVLGAIVEVVREVYGIARTLVPLVVADPRAATPGAAATSEPEKASVVPELVDSGLGLVAAVLDLTGENSDGSDGPDVRGTISTNASVYAVQLDAQLKLVSRNFNATENLLVSDPVRLSIAAANTNTTWNLPDRKADAVVVQIQDGMRRSLWTKLIQQAVTLWQWPTIPQDLQVTDISCQTNFSSFWFYSTALGPSAATRPVSRVDGNGRVLRTKSLVFTPVGVERLGTKTGVSRTLHGDLIEKFYDGTHFAPAEIYAALTAILSNYPGNMGWQLDECNLVNRTTGKNHYFPDADYDH